MTHVETCQFNALASDDINKLKLNYDLLYNNIVVAHNYSNLVSVIFSPLSSVTISALQL